MSSGLPLLAPITSVNQGNAPPNPTPSPMGASQKGKRKLNFFKCDYCRRDKKKCTPEERIWPQKCDWCQKNNLDCSESSKKQRKSQEINSPEVSSALPHQPSIPRESSPVDTPAPSTRDNLSLKDWDFLISYSKILINALDYLRKLRNQFQETFSPHEHYWDMEENRPGSYFSALQDLFSKICHIALRNAPEIITGANCADLHMKSSILFGQTFSYLKHCPYFDVEEDDTADITLKLHSRENFAQKLLHVEAIALTNPYIAIDYDLEHVSLAVHEKAISLIHKLELAYAIPVVSSARMIFISDALIFEMANSHHKPPGISGRLDCLGRTKLHQLLDILPRNAKQKDKVLRLVKDMIGNWEVQDGSIRQMINTQDILGRTALHLACQNNLADLAKDLLKEGADPKLHAEHGILPIHCAVTTGSVECCELLMDVNGGCGADAETRFEKTPLFYAIENEDSELVEILLNKSDQIGLNRDDKFHVPISKAVEINNPDIVRLLLHAGADPNKEEKYFSEFPLIDAVQIGNAEIVRLLLDAGAEPNLFESDRISALTQAVTQGSVELVKLLLNAEADPNLITHKGVLPQNEKGPLPLLVAASQGNTEIVRDLLYAGAKSEYSSDQIGDTALFKAVRNEDSEMVQRLLNMEDDSSFLWEERRPILLYAVARNHQKIVQLLLNAGVDPNCPSEEEYTPLSKAVENENLCIVRLLIIAGADPNSPGETSCAPLYKAVEKANIDIVRPILNAGADPNWSKNNAYTALYKAVEKTNVAIVRLLLNVGAKPNWSAYRFSNPLLEAVRQANVEIVQILLDAGADLSILPSLLCTIAYYKVPGLLSALADRSDLVWYPKKYYDRGFLSQAASRGFVEGVHFFLQRAEVDVNLKPFWRGYTALMHAVVERHESVVKLLLESPRVDIHARNKYGESALDLALDSGSTKIASMITTEIDKRAQQLSQSEAVLRAPIPGRYV